MAQRLRQLQIGKQEERRIFKIQTQPKAALVISFKTKNNFYQPNSNSVYYQVN